MNKRKRMALMWWRSIQSCKGDKTKLFQHFENLRNAMNKESLTPKDLDIDIGEFQEIQKEYNSIYNRGNEPIILTLNPR
ncbi:MAG: hypothetical protein ACQESA_02430 [Patescibacteria group bacterium]